MDTSEAICFKNDLSEIIGHTKALKILWPKMVQKVRNLDDFTLRTNMIEKLRTIQADIFSVLQIINENPLDPVETIVKCENTENEEIPNIWPSESSIPINIIENNQNLDSEYNNVQNSSLRSESVNPIESDFDHELIDWIIENNNNNHNHNQNENTEDSVEIKSEPNINEETRQEVFTLENPTKVIKRQGTKRKQSAIKRPRLLLINNDKNVETQDQVESSINSSQSNHSEEDSDQTLNEGDSSRDGKRRSTGFDGKRFRCAECNSWFVTKQNLTRHSLKHTGEKPFRCHFAECTKAYTQNVHLQAHIRAEHQGMWNQCHQCSSRFERKAYLELHIRSVHNGEKPYQCSYCPKTFSQKCSLKLHLQAHNGIKPHACPHCDYRSTIRGNLVSHIKRRHPDQ